MKTLVCAALGFLITQTSGQNETTQNAQAVVQGEWFNGGYRNCCRDTGRCESKVCTVFGYPSDHMTYCQTTGRTPTCVGSVCTYFYRGCVPSASSSSTCYGYVTCKDGSTSCEGAGELCLDAGDMTHFRVCGEDTCPKVNGLCPPKNACPKNYYWDGTACQLDKCAGVTTCKAAKHEHCNSFNGTCSCDEGWKRVNGACAVDKCAGVTCPSPQHCNAYTGKCECNDGFDRVGTTCVANKCLKVTCTMEHEHCNTVTGACDCDDGFVRDHDGDCDEDKCMTVECSEDAHEHCSPLTGACDCDDGWERVEGVCTVDKCATVKCDGATHEHCNAATGTCSCDDGYERSNGLCAENPCIGVICSSDNEHCNPATGNCDCNDGLERVGEDCKVDLCIGVNCSTDGHEHCNALTGTCDCNDGFIRDHDDDCDEDLCRTMDCPEDEHQHCNPHTGTCDCDDGWVRVDGSCFVDKCAALTTCLAENNEHCNAVTGICDCDDGYDRIMDLHAPSGPAAVCVKSCRKGYFRNNNQVCEKDLCANVMCNPDLNEHCNAATGTCVCNPELHRVDGICVADKCAGVVCSDDHMHCNANTGTCNCDDGWLPDSDGDCEEDKCAAVPCPPDGSNQHCNPAIGALDCDDGFVRAENGLCVIDMCMNVKCNCEYEHCNPITGCCDCNDGYERIPVMFATSSMERPSAAESANESPLESAMESAMESPIEGQSPFEGQSPREWGGSTCAVVCEIGFFRGADLTCQQDLCFGVTCNAENHEHCNAATGTCNCNDGLERVNGHCVADKCAGVVCTEEHMHCNANTGMCSCDDGWLPDDDGDCEENKCAAVPCPPDGTNQHCNPNVGSLDCDDGYLRADGVCVVDRCRLVLCQSDEHCNPINGACTCDDGFERVNGACGIKCVVGYFRNSDGECQQDVCYGVSCNVDGHEHCNAATGMCDCDDGWMRDHDNDCEEDMCRTVECDEDGHEHCNTGTGNCDCDDGYERVDGSCLDSCTIGHFRGFDLQCHVHQGCDGPNMIWDAHNNDCSCKQGFVLNPSSGQCDYVVPYQCIINDEANIMKQKVGKLEDIVVGKMSLHFDEATSSYTVSYSIDDTVPDLKFYKVWPLMNTVVPPDHSPSRWDPSTLRQFSRSDDPVRSVEITGLQVADVCSTFPAVKNLYLSTDLQFWEPSDSGFRAAAGYVDDGSKRSGRDKRDYRVIVQCTSDASQCSACEDQCNGPSQHCVWNLDGSATCQCDYGYRMTPDGRCVVLDACSLNGEFCPENSSCQNLRPGALCQCNPGYHKRTNDYDGSMECVRVCVLNGATSIKVNGGEFVGTMDVVLREGSPLNSLQYAIMVSLTKGTMKSIYFQTSQGQPETHIAAMFPNSVVLSTAKSNLRYPANSNQWLTLGGIIDCKIGAHNVYHVTTHVGLIIDGMSQKGWAKGKRTPDAYAQDFEFRIGCYSQCPAAANCQKCHANAECVWDESLQGPNKYACECLPGFRGDGTSTCSDINECALGSSIVCGSNTICTNTVGSYQCTCLSRNIYDAVLGCVSSTSTSLRSSEDSDVTLEVTEQCSTPSWVWITIGLMATALAVALSTVLVMSRQKEVLFFSPEFVAPRGEGSVPAPTVINSGTSSPFAFTSPCGLRRRPDSTPKSTASTPSSSSEKGQQPRDPLSCTQE